MDTIRTNKMNIDQEKLPKSIHFKIDQVADGVFAAYSLDGGAAIGNAGIIDLGDRTLIFDTFESPFAAEDLRVASEILTGKPATWVVNSHAHADHWFGNQVFPEETIIIASKTTCDNMTEYLEEVNQEKSDSSEIIEYGQSLNDQLSNEDNHIKRKIIESSIARIKYYLEALPSLNLRLPDQSFEGRVEFIGSQRRVVLVDVGAAHTSGDSYLTIQSENIAFLGDLGFFQEQPYMADSDPTSWLTVLHGFKKRRHQYFYPWAWPDWYKN